MEKSALRTIVFLSITAVLGNCADKKSDTYMVAVDVLKDSTIQIANRNILEEPITVTASHSPRSTGGIHDFYSEGDYWWPDSSNLDGPYVRRD
ncbi:MAG: alginate lyase, partial [Bacteroidota bacterium]